MHSTLLFLNIVINFGGFLHSELVMRIMGDLVVHKPTTAIVYNEKAKKRMSETNNDFLAGVSNWHSLDVQPPDTLVEVQDKNGNIAKAHPTYYPFKLGENKTGRKWGSEVIHCEPYWDGGWMIECQGLESNIDSSIVRWRACC